MMRNNIETTWLLVQLDQDIYGIPAIEITDYIIAHPEFTTHDMDEDLTTNDVALRGWLRHEIREVNLKNVIQVSNLSSKSLDEILDDPLCRIWITDITKL